MSKGYFIGLDDKTTCGGKVLDGDNRVTMFGLLHACEGDRVADRPEQLGKIRLGHGDEADVPTSEL